MTAVRAVHDSKQRLVVDIQRDHGEGSLRLRQENLAGWWVILATNVADSNSVKSGRDVLLATKTPFSHRAEAEENKTAQPDRLGLQDRVGLIKDT